MLRTCDIDTVYITQLKRSQLEEEFHFNLISVLASGPKLQHLIELLINKFTMDPPGRTLSEYNKLSLNANHANFICYQFLTFAL